MNVLRNSKIGRMFAAVLILAVLMCLMPAGTGQAQAADSAESPRVTGNNVRWDHVYFGHYPQDSVGGGTSYYNSPIKWRVIKVNDNVMTLVSEYKLDLQKYHTKNVSVTWNNSYLKQWLNSTFMNKAFTAEEQAAIFDDPNGKVQVLSKYELLDSSLGFINAPARAAKNTDYTIAKTKQLAGIGSDVINKADGIYYGACWLRETSSAKGLVNVYRGGLHGYMDNATFYVNNPRLDIRPVIHIDMNSLCWTHAENEMLNGAQRPGTVDEPQVSRSRVNAVKVKWNKRFEADGYEIYRQRNGEGYDKVACVEGTDKTSWVDRNLPLNSGYDYKVLAYWREGDFRKAYGEFSAPVWIGVSQPAVPKYVSGYPKGSKSKILMKWKPMSGVDGYEVKCSYTYRADGVTKTKTETKVTKNTEQTLNLTTVIKNYKAHTFKVQVRAYCNVEDNGELIREYGNWTKVKTKYL